MFEGLVKDSVCGVVNVVFGVVDMFWIGCDVLNNVMVCYGLGGIEVVFNLFINIMDGLWYYIVLVFVVDGG